MKIFFIRHAKTVSNGKMIKSYNPDILPFDTNDWFQKVGKFIPINNNTLFFSSPSKRCQQTIRQLFTNNYEVNENLNEFDCSGIGDRNFWEITEEEFQNLTNITKQAMIDKWENFLFGLLDKNYETAVVVSHGFYGRLVRSYYNRDEDTPLEILNSKNFYFLNLDMLEIEMGKVKEIYRYEY